MARLSRASESDSGGGPGGEEGARRQGSAEVGEGLRFAVISFRKEATSRRSSVIFSLVAAEGKVGRRALVTFASMMHAVRFRRLDEVVSPEGLGTG